MSSAKTADTTSPAPAAAAAARSSAATAQGEETRVPTMHVAAKAEAVTVYQNQLLIRRDAAVVLPQAYPDGIQISFPMPSSSFVEENVQVSFSDTLNHTATLCGVFLDTIDEPTTRNALHGGGNEPFPKGRAPYANASAEGAVMAQRVALRAQLRKLEEAIARVDLDKEAAKKKMAYVQAMCDATTDPTALALRGTPAMWDVEVWRKQLDNYAAAQEESARRVAALEAERDKLQDERAEVKRNMRAVGADPDSPSSDDDEKEEAGDDSDKGDKAVKPALSSAAKPRAPRQRVAVITIKTREPIPAEADAVIMVTYLSSLGSWSARYEAHLNTFTRQLELWYNAWLTLSSECEDLREVDLTFSTAAPKTHKPPPKLGTWRCGVHRNRKQSRFVPSSNGMAKRCAVMGEMAMPACPVQLAPMATATAAGVGTAVVNFHLPTRQSLPLLSCKEGRQIPLTALQLPVSLSYVCVPSLQPVAYARGTAVNTSAFPLLPGPVAVSADNRFVTNATLPLTPQGGKFMLHFGPDESLTVSRELVRKENVMRSGPLDKDATGFLGFLSSGGGRHRTALYEYCTTITNHKTSADGATAAREGGEERGSNAVLVSVVERAPKSHTPQLVVTLKQPDPVTHFARKKKPRTASVSESAPCHDQDTASLSSGSGSSNKRKCMTSSLSSREATSNPATAQRQTALPPPYLSSSSEDDEDEGSDGSGDGNAKGTNTQPSRKKRLYDATGVVNMKVMVPGNGGTAKLTFSFVVATTPESTIYGLEDMQDT